uniref:Putative E3 ubiquitin-protein ligase RF298 n=1 Tax=Anthurium amnicola TaxID=1678845 RepID=A0A1D1YYQ8_9ARAE
MAAAVARGSSQPSTSLLVQEKGSRNKRKFRADPPMPDLNKLVIPQTDCPNFESLLEKPSGTSHLENHASVCDLCSSLIGHSREEPDMEEFQEADWDDLAEAQLEDLLLNNLDTIFKTAIKRITSNGYTEEFATKAVLRTGLCYGSKDTLSNIVDNTLKLLKNGPEVDSSSKDHFFEDLQQLEKYILAEMVCVLREVRPFFTTGDAMWYLLLCDMNVSHACAMDGDPLSSLSSDDSRDGPSDIQLKPDSNSTTMASPSVTEFNATKPEKLNPVLPYPHNSSQPELPTVTGIPNLPSGRFSASRNVQGARSAPNTGRGKVNLSCDHVAVDSSSSSVSPLNLSQEKPVVSKKGLGGASKRESILRQKSVHYEKSYRAYGAKSSLKLTKLNGLGSFILDKKCKSVSGSTAANLKSASMKLSEAVGVDVGQADGSPNISFSAGISAGSTCSTTASKNPSPLHTTNTELSLSLPSTNSSSANHKPSTGMEMENCCSFLGIPSDNICGQWVPQDKKDEMLLKLVPRVRDLQVRLQEWTEWAQQKVMQAARRLSKDKVELHSLRQEKEDAIRVKKERKSLEDTTLKKLSEIEIDMAKASEQVDKSNTSVRTLEIDNAKLRYDMQAAKMQAAESAASCQEVSRREVKTLKKFQSWDKQKALLQEELLNEKRKLSQLQQQVMQAKEHQDQLEARWKQEEKVKVEALKLAKTEREERELLEASAKSKGDAIKLEAESNLQKYKDEIHRLENQIAQLRLKTDSTKIAALRWSIDGSKKLDVLKDSYVQYLTKMDLQDSVFGDVQRERECVMCLCDEMSVVFLPCAHQVVCTKCNELHEKQGMKDCPSCRAPIQRRICVRFSNS